MALFRKSHSISRKFIQNTYRGLNSLTNNFGTRTDQFDEEDEEFSNDQATPRRRQRFAEKQKTPGRPSQNLTLAFGELAETLENSVKLSDNFIGPRLESILYELGQIQSMQMSLMSAYAEEQQTRKRRTQSLQKQIWFLQNRLEKMEEVVTVQWIHFKVSQDNIPDSSFLKSPGLTYGPVTWHVELKYDVTGKLGVYVAPRTITNVQDIVSLKAKLEIHMKNSKLKINIDSDFVRPGSRKIMSWGKFIDESDKLFENGSLDLKFRLISQDVAYKSEKDESKLGTTSSTSTSI